MALNEKVSITLGDDKMFGIGIIEGIITEESLKEGKRSLSVQTISPIKKPNNYPDPFKPDLEFQRYKQDCRKRALDLAHAEFPDRKNEKRDVLKNAEEYYNWLISIPEK